MARLAKIDFRAHSLSSMKTYEQCPHKYLHQYVHRTDVGERQVPTHWRFGSVGHAALEGAAKAVRDGICEWADAREPAFDALDAAWVEYRMPPHGGEFDRAKGIILETLADERISVTKKDLLGIEHKFLDVTDDGSGLVGYADRVDHVGKEGIRIIDYKFSSKALSSQEVQESPQLNLYSWAAMREWPWVKEVYLAHYYPPINKLVQVGLDREILIDTLARFEAYVEASELDKEHKPRPSSECGSCVYSNVCPLFEGQGIP